MRWLIWLLAVVMLAPGAGAAAPCTTAGPECVEWVTVGGAAVQTPIDRTYPLGERADGITGDRWPFGLQARAAYSARVADADLKAAVVGLPVTSLLGGLDILPLFGFDTSCAAMAQGPTRLARGLAYARYVSDRHGASHRTVLVPSCGHDARCMFTADDALGLIFPKE